MAIGTKQRLVETIVVLLVMINVGVNVGIYSPTFPDMEKLTSSTTAQMSRTLIWTGVASVCGALAVGPLFDRLNGMLLMAVCLLLQGVAIGLAPTWPSLAKFQALVAVAQFFNFALTSGCLSMNCALWKSVPAWLGPVVQATDLMHALGAALTPQIIRPFITGHDGHSEPHPSANATPAPFTPNTTTGPTGILPVQTAYLVVALYDASMALVCLLTAFWSTACCRRRRPAEYYPVDSSEDHLRQLLNDTASGASGGIHIPTTSTSSHLEPRSRSAIGLLVVMCIFFTVNGGRDALLTGLLFTYVNEYLLWTVASSTLLVTLYHVTRVVVHAILVPASRWISPTRLTVANLFVLVVSAGLMFAAVAAGWTFTGAGVLVTGLATSNLHPTTITLIEESIHVGAPVMALLMSGVAAGQIVFAPLAGWLLQISGAASFPAILLALALTGTALFGVYCVLLQSAIGGRRAARDGDDNGGGSGVESRSSDSGWLGRRRRRSVTTYSEDEGDVDLFARKSIINPINP